MIGLMGRSPFRACSQPSILDFELVSEKVGMGMRNWMWDGGGPLLSRLSGSKAESDKKALWRRFRFR